MRGFLLWLGLGLAPLPAVAAPALFTAAQAASGAATYGRDCASCHGTALQGVTGPALVGQAFASAADHYTVALVFNNIWQGTPAGAPDSLSQTEYVDIMAYIMARNGLPAGMVALTYRGAAASGAPFYSLVK
jgi:mono/diheme cytochrome c family protein